MDSAGSDDFNHRKSERQPDAVKSYLMRHGIASTRLTPSGKREALPKGDNSPATNGQQEPRVEVIRKH
jgi:outer membrane protein OmpA-like peptidoglycan-associated protein